MGNKNKRWIIAVPFIVTGCFMLASIIHYGVNVPFWDEWDTVPLFQKADQHTLSFDDLWRQHNEHRIFFPNIVVLLNAYITRWNIKAEAVLGLAFSLITALMLYLFVLSKVSSRPLALLSAAVIAVWFYSPIQYENWLWGFQVCWFMCIAGSVAAMYLLDRIAYRPDRLTLLLTGAIACAVITTFSLGNGMLIWPVGLGILLLHRQTRRAIVVWLASFALTMMAYYYHYQRPAGDSTPSVIIHQPVNFVRYILNYYGGVVTNNANTAMLIGAILLLLLIPLLYITWLNRATIKQCVPWIALIFFSLLSGLATSTTRLGLGPEQSLASRYTSISLLYIIGLIGLSATLLSFYKLRRHTITLILLTALALNTPLLIYSYKTGIHGLRGEHNSFLATRACTKQTMPDDNCLSSAIPTKNTQSARQQLDYIKHKHWAGY